MKINGKHYRTIWVKKGDNKTIQIIDQRSLPHKLVIEDLKSVDDFARAIREMHVRGAGLIGATAGFGMYIACLEAPENDFENFIKESGEKLKKTRPTAINLKWAVERQIKVIKKENSINEKIKIAFKTAQKIADEDADFRRGEIRKLRVRPIYLREESVSVPCAFNHHALVSVLRIGEEGGPKPVESERKREYAIVITHRDEKVLRGDLLAVLNRISCCFCFYKVRS